MQFKSARLVNLMLMFKKQLDFKKLPTFVCVAGNIACVYMCEICFPMTTNVAQFVFIEYGA